MEDLMIKIDNVTKEYKLGQIGGTTLQDELQRLRAKLRHQEDPTKKIGAKDYNKGETFMALNGVSFEVKKGERVGIIGHNGAGKSTLLKLLSRITAPTSGEIGLNGRITSMLEVGTGFHHELTGRENIYMNGAILGMTKKEIDTKIEDIIEFSECRQFIDTPVKRYSSGMYVKLAFSVAAHLDSEIMIMDEVLAVGDMAFQQKCLDKMNDVSRKDGRTILYVSHNMNTIRQLCDRVVVLDHGQVIYDGEVEEGINIYMGIKEEYRYHYDYTPDYRKHKNSSDDFIITSLDLLNNKTAFQSGEPIRFSFTCKSQKKYNNIMLRIVLEYQNGQISGTAFSNNSISCAEGENKISSFLNTNSLINGTYRANIILFNYNQFGQEHVIDGVYPGFIFEIVNPINASNKVNWLSKHWGSIRLPDNTIEIS